jgi:hypothetical protein
MNENNEIQMQALVGKHLLSGVDESILNIKRWDDDFENCQCINFVLDGKTYTAIEDPDDGYRSSMDKLIESEEVVSNVFSSIEVLCLYKDKTGNSYSTDCDILEFYDTENGKKVLEIGTDNTDDYYPSFVASFVPENFSKNNNIK